MLNTQRLKSLRKEKKLTQEQLAKSINIERSTYVRYENGEIVPPADMVNKIALLHDVSTDFLFGNTNDPTPPNKQGRFIHPEEALQILARGKGLTEKDIEYLKETIKLLETKNRLSDENKAIEASASLQPHLT